MSRGGNYQTIFVNDGDRELFLKLVGKTCEMWHMRVHAYMNPAKKRNDINALLHYPWSSNSYYLGKRKKPEWLSVSKILNLFSENTRMQKSLYKEFITDKIPDEILQKKVEKIKSIINNI